MRLASSEHDVAGFAVHGDPGDAVDTLHARAAGVNEASKRVALKGQSGVVGVEQHVVLQSGPGFEYL
jgi:hypothetical protein